MATGCPPRVPVLRCIFNQGTYGTTAGYSESEYSDFFGGESQLGDNFMLTEGNSTVTHVSWYGAYRDNVPVTDDFLLTVFRDNGTGMPETGGYWEWRAADAVTRTATDGLIAPGAWDVTIYEYSCDVSGWNLEPDTTYFLSIVNDTGKWMWCFNGSPTQGDTFSVARDSWGDDWGANGLDLTFRLWSDE
jgi:hypothetical protein